MDAQGFQLKRDRTTRKRHSEFGEACNKNDVVLVFYRDMEVNEIFS